MALDTSIYERRRRDVNADYTDRAATNAYSRFISQQRGERGIQDYTQSFSRNTPKFTAGFGKRGLTGGGVKTGIYQNAMKNYLGDYNQNLNRSVLRPGDQRSPVRPVRIPADHGTGPGTVRHRDRQGQGDRSGRVQPDGPAAAVLR